MSQRVSRRHAFRQGPVVKALIETAIAAVRPRPTVPPELPGQPLTRTVSARSPVLVNDYIRHVGGDPASYRGTLPPHLFPQWGFPLLAKTLTAVPYDLRRVLNGGCRIESHAPLPAGEPLELAARLESIDDNGRRAVIKNHLTTGTKSAPGAVEAWMYAVVPLSKGAKSTGNGEKKERPTVPHDSRELAFWRIRPADAMGFALLTGDFNPVHWVPPYARAAGFRGTILHGFATLARAYEALVRTRFAGDASRIAMIDVKFVKPLVLPAEVGLYVHGNTLTVGTGHGSPAYLTGIFEERRDG